MPSAAVVAPIVLPLIAAAVIAGFGASGVNLGRMAAGIGAWSSALALVVVWLPVRSSLELILGQLGYGSTFDLRLDAVSVAFGLMIVVPAAVLLTLQPRTWQESALAMLGVAAAVACGGEHGRDAVSARFLHIGPRLRARRRPVSESGVQHRAGGGGRCRGPGGGRAGPGRRDASRVSGRGDTGLWWLCAERDRDWHAAEPGRRARHAVDRVRPDRVPRAAARPHRPGLAGRG